MLSIVTIEPNSKGKIHSHPQEQWGFLIEGSGIRIQGNEEIEINKGDFWQTPGGVDQDLYRLGYKKIKRPMFPLDRDMEDPDLNAVLIPVLK